MKIIAAKTADEAKEYFDRYTIAVSGLLAESEEESKKADGLKVPVFKSATQVTELADLIEQKSMPHC
jgi:hypothetical protein